MNNIGNCRSACININSIGININMEINIATNIGISKKHHQLSNIVGTMPNKPTCAQLKRRHERAVADTVIRIVGVPGVFLRMGNDHGEPDVIFEIAGRTLGH